jgi:hypothetical protein
MAANALVHAAPGWASGEVLTPAQITQIDTLLSQAPNRNSTQSGTRVIALDPVDVSYFDAGVVKRLCIPTYGVLTCVNAAEDIYIPMHELPHGHVLTTTTLKVIGAAGHGALPGTPPVLDIYKVTSGGVATSLGHTHDPSANFAAYEVAHDVAVSAMAHTIDRATYCYWAKIVLESGLNSVTGMTILSLTAACTIDHTVGGVDLSLWV